MDRFLWLDEPRLVDCHGTWSSAGEEDRRDGGARMVGIRPASLDGTPKGFTDN